jgi:protein-tyrosine phosphatase
MILNRKNIHLIESHGQKPIIYRSAQLKPKDIKSLIKQKKIDTILNLRGESETKIYLREKKLSSKLQVDYYPYGFSMYRPPDKKRFLDILNLLDKVKVENKTLLIHCRAGADRTGLIAAITQIVLYDFSVDEAFASSYNKIYGHLPNPNGPLEQVLSRYKEFENEMSFREWVETKYKRKEIINYAVEHDAIPDSIISRKTK